MKAAGALLAWLARTLAILALVISGSTVLVRFAPGYLSDAREMDTRYGGAARAELWAEAARSGSLVEMLASEARNWMRGDAGLSREFGVPVAELIRPRLAVTGRLLFEALILAWTMAVCASLFTSASMRALWVWQTPATLLLAVPTAAMATVCLLSDIGGPVLVMALLLAARDFKFLHRALRAAWLEPCVLHARAQGLRPARLLWAHVIPATASQLAALASLSIVTALSALVPVEVIFNVPGLGQLAWNAAMNRDLPVLLAITAMMALAVTVAGLGNGRDVEWRTA